MVSVLHGWRLKHHMTPGNEKFAYLKGGLMGISHGMYVGEKIMETGEVDFKPRTDSTDLLAKIFLEAAEQDGVDTDNPDHLFAYALTLQSEHYGAYLLLRTLSHATGEPPVLMSSLKDTAGDLPGLGVGMDDLLVSAINLSLFHLESALRSATTRDHSLIVAKKLLAGVLESIQTTLNKESPLGFMYFLSAFERQHPWWGHALAKLLLIFDGKETPEENALYFSEWWSGQPPSYLSDSKTK